MDWTEHFSGWCHPARSCPYHINRSSVLCASSDTGTPVELPTVAPSSVQFKSCDASVQNEKTHVLSILARHHQPLIECPDPDSLSQSLPGKARLHCNLNMRIAGLAFPQGSSPAVQMFSLLDFSAVALGGGVDVRRSYYWVLGNLEGNTVYTVCTASTDERRHDSDAGGRAGGRRTPRTPWHVPEVCACMRICIYVPVRPCAMEKLDEQSCSLADGHATGSLS